MNKKKPITHSKYANAECFKLKNKRIAIVDSPHDEDIFIQMTIMDGELAPRTTHEIMKGKAVVTTFRVSQEAAIALAKGLKDRLNSKGIF